MIEQAADGQVETPLKGNVEYQSFKVVFGNFRLSFGTLHQRIVLKCTTQGFFPIQPIRSLFSGIVAIALAVVLAYAP